MNHFNPQKEEKLNYGNWIPRRINFIFLLIATVLFLSLFIVPIDIIEIIFIILAGFFLIGFLYLEYAYWLLGKNEGKLQKEFYNVLLNHLEWNGQGKALDIGTGNGPVAILLAKKYTTAKVIGIDFWGKPWNYSKQICERNAIIEHVDDRVQFRKASAMELPFYDGEFDAIISNFVFNAIRVDDRKVLIKEALRTLKENGSFAIQDVFNKQFYGNINRLRTDVKSWGLKKVEFIFTSSIIKIPKILKINHIAGNSGIFFGIK